MSDIITVGGDMSGARKTAAWLYGVTSVISIGLGSYYVFRGSFMPYHAAAIGMDWQALTPEMRTLFLALLDVAGAGWAVTGGLVLTLVVGPFRRGEIWARWLIPMALLLLYALILLATLQVLTATPASPPWYGNVLALLATGAGLIFDRPWQSSSRP